jgi:hypothetical protein
MAGSIPPIGDNLASPGQVVKPLEVGLAVRAGLFVVRLEAERLAATQKLVIQR